VSLDGVWKGTVTRLVGGRPMVEIPRLARGAEYGPCESVEGFASATEALSQESVGDHGTHTHSVTAPASWTAGDRVLVAFVEGNQDDPVVVGRLA
jgi:hypothetical protein